MNAMKDVYLVEKCGDFRSIWGPYTEGHARREAGKLYWLMRGGPLVNRKSIPWGILKDLMSLKSVWILDA